MAELNQRVSELDFVTTLSDNDIVYIVEVGAFKRSRKAALSTLKSFINAGASIKSGFADTANSYVVTIPDFSTYPANGTLDFFWVQFTETNTGDCTLNVNNLGAIPLRNTNGLPLAAGDIIAGQILNICYISGIFKIVSAGDKTKETSQSTIETINSTEADKYVSTRRFWQGLTKVISSSWNWLEKQTFSKGVMLGNNAAANTDGDMWYNPSLSALQARISSQNTTIVTSLNGKVGRVLFVSKDGNNGTAQIGNQAFSFATIQAAINASSNYDTIVVFPGTYTENINGRPKTLSFVFLNVNLIGSVQCADGTIIDGSYGSTISNPNAVDTLYCEGSLKVVNFKSITRSIAHSTVDVFAYANITLENIETFGSSAFPLRIGGQYVTASFTFKNVHNIWLNSYTQPGIFEFYNSTIYRIAYENTVTSTFYFKNCTLYKNASSLYFSMYKLYITDCRVIITDTTTVQFAQIRDLTTSEIRVFNTGFYSSSPSSGYLFDFNTQIPLKFIMSNCIGNIPLVNLKDFTATNEDVDYKYLSYFTL